MRRNIRCEDVMQLYRGDIFISEEEPYGFFEPPDLIYDD